MKHVYLLLLLFLTITTAQAQILNIPDANFKAKLLNHNPVIDTNGDGEIQITEAENFAGAIDVGNDSQTPDELKIMDMTGIEAFINITALWFDYNKVQNIELTYNTLLNNVNCSNNKLTSLDLSKNPLLMTLRCSVNLLQSINLSNSTELTHLWCSDNLLETIDLSSATKLFLFISSGNRFTTIDLSNNLQLETLWCTGGMLTSLDLSNNAFLASTLLYNNYFLKTVNITNRQMSVYNNFSVRLEKCPNLETVCVDNVNSALKSSYFIDPHAVLVEDCSVSTVDYNTIQGVLTLDENNNGCDGADPIIPNILIKSTDGTNTFATLTDTNGTYSIPVVAKTYETTPQGLFSQGNISINPTSYTTTFTGFSNTETADFCINFNQNSYDLNVKLIPIIPARPGFDTIYQLVYENLGVTVDSGSIILTFDDTMQSFVSASPAEDASTSNTITFNFTNLKPFEKRVINVTMNTFTPPTVNGDDILNFVATITPTELDVTPEDNTYILAQTVVNSFDPNDKQVLQGTEITVDETGNYLDYIIRFQNTGTASAINVAITDVLTPRLDWDSIKIISASHPYSTRITNGNFVEFIFNNINLPAEQEDEPASHGFIAFKIKPRSTVVIGDIISGNASIYFDYNAPIITNSVSTTVVENTLSINKNELEASLRIYPNPATTELNIKVSKDVKVNKVSFYSVTGKLLFSTLKTSSNYDLTNFKSGIYFVKVETNKGVVNKKIIKK